MISVTGQSNLNTLPMSPYLNRIKPWVTVICTSFNHEAYVADALQSVIDQDYPNVELIVIDNGSTDATASRIADFVAKHPAIQFIQNPTNVGLNRAFNQGLALACGRYLIDLAADDVLLPGRISRQADLFERLAGPYAVVFSNAVYIDREGKKIAVHYPVDEQGRAIEKIPSGDVFRQLLESSFISTPTMMMRRDVLQELGGYDESLAYEDFDFWVRSSRLYQYAYLDEVLMQKRRLPDSLSAQVVLPDNRLLASSLAVCRKALDRCRTPDESHALAERIRRFVRKAFYAEQFKLALQFGGLLHQIEQPGLLTELVLGMSRLHVPVNGLYRKYIRWHYSKQMLPHRNRMHSPFAALG
ncbi:glycosyltransferase [Spirosoma montaniterrae]|uniref:Glycosyl transferase family 2 n=1 Tax=Spirosoma montaniterrae TaxID=1178516 RepID=A0A1P9WU97_9BACT|nr:glycosyltransferase [Spirosoma montaniterrae]AQG78954.1 glycosyl transferase family 2 [Spirosoma montaniterrae]